MITEIYAGVSLTMSLLLTPPLTEEIPVIESMETIIVEESYETFSEEEKEKEYIAIESSAYCDEGKTADGSDQIENFTLAGKREWLGKSVELYTEEMEFMGIYEFHDVGYGKPSGIGESEFKSHKGKSMGTIEIGTCIDIYMSTEKECKKWGRRTVYIVFIESEE